MHHDAAACALAEVRWGADAGVAGLAYLTCGTGFGAGLVIDGRARYGSRGYSPELGHIRYRDDGPDVFGKPGSFESYGAASALPKLARRIDPSFDAATGADVAARAQRGDDVARRALDENAEAVGAACALLADLLVLDVIVLGSLAAYLGEPWIARVRATFEREALPHHAAACTLRAPSLPNLQDLSGLRGRARSVAAEDALLAADRRERIAQAKVVDVRELDEEAVAKRHAPVGPGDEKPQVDPAIRKRAQRVAQRPRPILDRDPDARPLSSCAARRHGIGCRRGRVRHPELVEGSAGIAPDEKKPRVVLRLVLHGALEDGPVVDLGRQRRARPRRRSDRRARPPRAPRRPYRSSSSAPSRARPT